jgi:hypothetical protein
MKYHRKPQQPIEGFEWTGDEACLPSWAKEEHLEVRGDRLMVPNSAGLLVAHIGDHVLRPKPGDTYVVAADYAAERFDIKEN